MEADDAPRELKRGRPRVSVLIPTYNRAGLLAEAVASVLAQTHRDLEIVVVDDGSTDDTAAIAHGFGEHVRYLAIPHAGPVQARNVAFENARGEYLCLLDSDDLYYPHKLALQVDFLERHPDVVMVYTEFSSFDDDGHGEEFHLKSYHRSAYRKAACSYERMFPARSALSENHLLVAAAATAGAPHWRERSEYVGHVFERYLHDTIVFTNSMMFRRSVLDSTGLQDPYFGHFHDLEFALRICRLGPVGFIDNPTYKLRYHTGQVSTLNRPDGNATFVKLQRDLLRVARVHALADRSYYHRNQRAADALVGRLARAAAVPLITYGGPSGRRRRSFSRHARRYLRFAAARGQWHVGLWLISYCPATVRRVCFAVASRWRLLGDTVLKAIARPQ